MRMYSMTVISRSACVGLLVLQLVARDLEIHLQTYEIPDGAQTLLEHFSKLVLCHSAGHVSGAASLVNSIVQAAAPISATQHGTIPSRLP
jgi:hypothetical protein